MNKIRKGLLLPIILATVAIVSLAMSTNVYADSAAKDKIVKKSYLYGLNKCYTLTNGGTDGDYKSLIYGNTQYSDSTQVTAGSTQIDPKIVSSSYDPFTYVKLFNITNAKNKVRLPNGWTPESSGDGQTNCAHLVNGGDGFSDTIYDRFGKPNDKVTASSSTTSIENFMKAMGYKKDSSGGEAQNGRKCFFINYEWQKYTVDLSNDSWTQTNEKGKGKSNTLCADIENNVVTELLYPDDIMPNSHLIMYLDTSGGYYLQNFEVRYEPSEEAPDRCRTDLGRNCDIFGDDHQDLMFIDVYNNAYSWNDFYAQLNTRVKAMKPGKENFANAMKTNDESKWLGVTGISIETTDAQTEDVAWVIDGSNSAAAQKAVKHLGSGSSLGSLTSIKITESEEVVTYQHYIVDMAKGVVKCDLENPAATDIQIKWFETANERKTCYLTSYENSDMEYNVVGSDRYFSEGLKIKDLIDKLNAITITKLTGVDDAIESSQSTIEQNQEDPNNDKEVTCYTAGGSLGWILCPILEFTTDTVSTLYDSVIEPYLAMDASLFTSGSGDKTYEAWQTFQGIANICFVILFIIVIFSQITGVGIDNYGIKKILPKLITAALLINLSYIICEIAIDASNIVGSGIKSIFDGLKSDVSISEITVENGTKASFGATAITGGVALLAVIVGAAALYTNGAAILIPLFIAAISVLVSIFFLFVLLSLRKAAVVILVVVSPLALGCYMLPNTKKLFDRWFKAFQGMLLLYPIAGALVGGGNYVSKILLSTGNGTADFFFALSAMIIGIVPIFFMPGLLKSSFAAIGNIGTKLSGLSNKYGGKLKNYTRNGLENTRLTDGRNYRRMMKADARKARTGAYNVGQARKTVDRLGQKKIGAMSARERSQLRAAQSVVDSENKSMRDLYASRFDEISDPEAIGDELLAVGGEDKFDVNMATAAIEKMGSANQKVMLDKLGEFSKTKAWKNMSDSDRAKIADTLAAQKGNVVAKSYAKTLRTENVSLEQALQGGVQENASGNQVQITSIGERINQMGASALTDTDKDVFEYIATQEYNDANGNKQNLINSFNSEQVGHAISHLDGQSKEGKGFQAAIQKRTDLAGDISSMSVEDFASSKYANLAGRTRDDGVREAIKVQVNKAVKNDNVKDKLDAGYIQYIDKGSNTNNTSPNGANT